MGVGLDQMSGAAFSVCATGGSGRGLSWGLRAALPSPGPLVGVAAAFGALRWCGRPTVLAAFQVWHQKPCVLGSPSSQSSWDIQSP